MVVFDPTPGVSFRVPITILMTGPQQQMVPITSVLTGEETVANTYVTYVQAPQGFGSLLTIEVVAVGIVIVLVVIVLIYNEKRVRSQPPSTNSVTQKTEQVESKTAKVMPAKQFCMECGAELTMGSKFCNKCGTQQPQR
jgi:ribosomal protein L40E